MGIKKNLIATFEASPWAVPPSVVPIIGEASGAGATTLVAAPAANRVICVGLGTSQDYFGHLFNQGGSDSYVRFTVDGTVVWSLEISASGMDYMYPQPLILPAGKPLVMDVEQAVDILYNLTYAELDASRYGGQMTETDGISYVNILGPAPAGKTLVPMVFNSAEQGMVLVNNDDITHGYEIHLYDGVNDIEIRDAIGWPVQENRTFWRPMPPVTGNQVLRLKLDEPHNSNPCVALVSYAIIDAA